MKDPAARFWPKVRKTDGCWIWTANLTHKGYGLFYVYRNDDRSYFMSAHRFSWTIVNGAIPNGMCILHHCDNRACVRPEHLFMGTVKDNNMDMFQKGRNRAAKLTKEQVKEIKKEQSEGWYVGQDRNIASRYGVSRPTILRIRLNRRWTHINCPIPANAGSAVPSGLSQTGI